MVSEKSRCDGSSLGSLINVQCRSLFVDKKFLGGTKAPWRDTYRIKFRLLLVGSLLLTTKMKGFDMSLLAARARYADAAADLWSYHDYMETDNGKSNIPQGRKEELWFNFYAAKKEYDAALLAEKTRAAVPEWNSPNLAKDLKSLVEQLRRPYVPVTQENTQSITPGNQSHETAQPDQPPKKKTMAEAIERMFNRSGNTGFRLGVGAVIGAGLTVASFGLLGLGGLGFLGVTAAVCGVASYGLLGAGLYAGYKYRSNLLPSYPEALRPSHMIGSHNGESHQPRSINGEPDIRSR